MTRKQDFLRLAGELGVEASSAQYNRRGKHWALYKTLPNPNGIGYIDRTIGVYASVAEARERLPGDWESFQRMYLPDVTKSYDTVTAPNDKQRTHQLLDLLTETDIDPELVAAARRYITQLEKPPKTEATTYQSDYPDQEKASIAWNQPTNRKAPIYEHQITCRICSTPVTIRNHSPHTPPTCEQEACTEEHRRRLARERKRKQRAREKSRSHTAT